MNEYDHTKIEQKWQKNWKEKGIYKTENASDKPKCYVLDMFPYPSGEGLHVGHPKGYIATDVYSRYKRMDGYNVLHPMGWDAFGLPAENYALKNKTHPRIAVEKNVERYKEQLENIGFNYDWSREINTTDPEYYKWTQWAFLQMFKKGLAYESNAPINWCPSCKTGLANEDLEDGKCERCGSEVEQKPIRQWVLRITEYAERLLDDLSLLDKWTEYIREMQRNWIGKKTGTRFSFKIAGKEVDVFTTRPDTLFGVTYLVLAPEHPSVQDMKESIENWSEVEAYIEQTRKKGERERQENKEKTGVELKGVVALHPATGEEVPVWVADYVLASYGTGAVMAVPAHDERDFEFAMKFDLPVKEVVNSPKYCIFDFDGVIGDTFEDSIVARCEFGMDANRETCIEQILGYCRVKPDHSRDSDPERIKASDKWTEDFAQAMAGVDVKIFDKFVEEIKKTGVTHVAIVSSGSRSYVDRGLKKTDLNPTHILAYEDHHSKEEKVEHICRDWGVEVKDVYYFTDTKADVYELENILDRKKLIGCSWGFLGKEELEEVLPSDQVLVDYDDIHSIFPPYVGMGEIHNSAEFNGMESLEAMEKITEKYGKKETTYRLQDWVFSRQRYWGEPIPLIHCDECGVVAVPEEDLPVVLPEVESYEPTGTGESPLAGIEEWVNTTCPKCGGNGKRETNTMPQWAGSCWYYLRYMDPQNSEALVDKDVETYWSPVDVYVGGAEHATRHLIYARFWHKFLKDIGVVSTDEPFVELHSVGLIQAADGRKMSKRFGNVINPDDIVERVGADTLRVYEMFMGPFENTIAWNTDSMVGARRFLERVWRMKDYISSSESEDLTSELHRTIKKVGDDITSFKFNTAIAQMMVFINLVEEHKEITKHSFEMFLKALAPFAPHITEELWSLQENASSIHLAEWPSYDEGRIQNEEVTIVVQIDGKVRASFSATPGESQEILTDRALTLSEIEKWIKDIEIKKVIVVPDKLVSIVTK